jgi:hypothetical protein
MPCILLSPSLLESYRVTGSLPNSKKIPSGHPVIQESGGVENRPPTVAEAGEFYSGTRGIEPPRRVNNYTSNTTARLRSRWDIDGCGKYGKSRRYNGRHASSARRSRVVVVGGVPTRRH